VQKITSSPALGCDPGLREAGECAASSLTPNRKRALKLKDPLSVRRCSDANRYGKPYLEELNTLSVIPSILGITLE
jgi:hypothetical protein